MCHSNTSKGLLTALGLAGFAVISYFITQGAVLPLDTSVQEAVFSMRSQWITALLIPLTYSGNWQTVAVVCGLLLLLPPTRKHYGVPMTVSALLSVSFYETLKFIFQRPRPDFVNFLIPQGGFSFPSGHALTGLVVWGTALLLIRRYSRLPRSGYEEKYDFPHVTNGTAVSIITILLCAYILLMGFSRVYLGVHYPTDILASWCLGLCMLTALESSYFCDILEENH